MSTRGGNATFSEPYENCVIEFLKKDVDKLTDDKNELCKKVSFLHKKFRS